MFRIIKAVSGALILIFLFTGLANAQNDHSWYVSNGGDDGNNGWTSSTPQQTLGGGILDSLSAGDTLYLMGGEFHEYHYAGSYGGSDYYACFPLIGIDGTAENPIVIRNYPGTFPEIHGDSADIDTLWRVRGCMMFDCSHIVIDSIRFTQSLHAGLTIRNCDTITVQYCQMDSNYLEGGGDNGGGLFVAGYSGSTWINEGLFIYKNRMFDNGLDTAGVGQTNADEFLALNMRHSIVRGNNLTGSWSGGGLRLKGWNCIGNLIDSNTIYGNRSGYEVAGQCDSNKFCYNVLYDCKFAIYIYSYLAGTNDANQVYNNTIYNYDNDSRGISTGLASSYATTSVTAESNCSYFNNIVYNTDIAVASSPMAPLMVKDIGQTYTIFDYNSWFGQDSAQTDIVNWDQTLYTLSEHRSAHSMGDNSIWGDPEFLSTNPGDPNFLRVPPNTPAADSGRGAFEGGPYKTYMGAIDPYLNSDPHMSVNPGNLSFAAEPNGAIPQPKTFNLQNTGGDVLNWNISDNAQWLSVSPASGSNNSQVVTVNIVTTNLSVGDYTGAITITSSNADNNPQTVMVYYSVSNDVDPPDPVEDYGCNQALKIPALVSSTSPGYNAAVITDGVIDPYNDAATTWKSYSSSTAAPWIEIDFGEPKLVKHVLIYWAWNDNASSWATSQAYYIQAWSDAAGYVDLRGVIDPVVGEKTRTEFSTPVNTSRIRVIQLPNSGNQYSQDVMWLSELEICVIN